MYYGEDTSDQWKRKKQTKAEAKAARRGKLDPDSELNRNAKEVMDERARNKRKLHDMQDEDEISSDGRGSGDDKEEINNAIERERPGEGLEKRIYRAKKQKTADEIERGAEKNSKPNAKKEMRPLKQEKREERKRLMREKKGEEKRLKVGKGPIAEAFTVTVEGGSQNAATPTSHHIEEPGEPVERETKSADPMLPTETFSDDESMGGDEMAPLDVSGLVTNDNDEPPSHTTTPNSLPESPVFDTTAAAKIASVESASTTTSISSIIPPSERPKHIKIPTDTTALRIRLAAKIEALRAARKADGVDGKPIRTRQELIESRREKQAQRRAHKKEMHRLAKLEEERKREEALASSRNSPGGALSPMVDLEVDNGIANHFAFGRVAFADGTEMSHDLSYVREPGKKKGPSDPKTALAKFEAQKKRIAGLGEDKRKEVLEKETWLAARRRVEGTKVHDDETLLKRAVKRKEKAKRKSEGEWRERVRGVENAIRERQKKREDNIRMRKEDKIIGKAGRKKDVKAAKRNRAGFEGSFASRRPR